MTVSRTDYWFEYVDPATEAACWNFGLAQMKSPSMKAKPCQCRGARWYEVWGRKDCPACRGAGWVPSHDKGRVSSKDFRPVFMEATKHDITPMPV